MLRFAIRRSLWALAIVLLVSAVTYGLLFVASDPATVLAGSEATQEDIENLRRSLGIDAPVHIRYIRWAVGLLHGDFGTSFRTQRPALDDISANLPATALLALVALALSLAIAIPLGIGGAVSPGTLLSALGNLVAAIGQAVPLFWLGILLTIFFGVQLKWLPISGAGTVRHLVLPALTLALYLLPATLRLTQTAMLETLQKDFVRTAKAKGVPRRIVVLKHALRPALVSVIGVVAIQMGTLLGGTVVIESVFAWPGVGTLALRSITAGDVPVVLGIVMIMSVVFVLLTTLSDLLVAFLDPRIRQQ